MYISWTVYTNTNYPYPAVLAAHMRRTRGVPKALPRVIFCVCEARLWLCKTSRGTTFVSCDYGIVQQAETECCGLWELLDGGWEGGAQKVRLGPATSLQPRLPSPAFFAYWFHLRLSSLGNMLSSLPPILLGLGQSIAFVH